MWLTQPVADGLGFVGVPCEGLLSLQALLLERYMDGGEGLP